MLETKNKMPVMDVIDLCVVNLAHRFVKKLPEDVCLRGRQVVTLNLSFNAGIKLDDDLRSFKNVTKLMLDFCEMRDISPVIQDLTQLEEFSLNGNESLGSLDPALGRLHHLKKLNISRCGLKTLPDSLGDIEWLEELILSRNGSLGILNPTLGRLKHLRTLDASSCGLTSLPDWLGDLEVLEELVLSDNDSLKNLNGSLGRLRGLRKFSVANCGLQELPDYLLELEMLEELMLNDNDCLKSLNPGLGSLQNLRKLTAANCGLNAVPDSLRYLKMLTFLDLSNNRLEVYPCSTLHLEYLTDLDLSTDITSCNAGEGVQQGNCISVLPVELVNTNLKHLHLEGNPVTNPPEEILRHGIDFIKFYMRGLASGTQVICADTINIIGDARSGKTSIALSLARSSVYRASVDTGFMHKCHVTLDHNIDVVVAINDFGGRNICEYIMPPFCRTDGLFILAYDLTDDIEKQEYAVRKWLLTVVAKSKDPRVIIVGTRSNYVDEDRLSFLIEHMRTFSSCILKDAAAEAVVLNSGNRAPLFSTVKRTENHVDSLVKLKKVPVMTLGYTSDSGLAALQDCIASMLRPPIRLPLQWYRVMDDIIYATSMPLYLEWKDVERIFKSKVLEEGSGEELVDILRFITSVSQVIWLEDHPKLRGIVFHSPQYVLELFKHIVERNEVCHRTTESKPLPSTSIDECSSRIMCESSLVKLLLRHADSMDVIVDFCRHFNLVGQIASGSRNRKYIIASSLPVGAPSRFGEFEKARTQCLFSITLRLSFLGSIVPVSFFESSVVTLLDVARELGESGGVSEVWNDGLIILHDGAQFSATLLDGVITFTAFAEGTNANPWTILHPVIRRFAHNMAVSWFVVLPRCTILCPACGWRRRQLIDKSYIGEISVSFLALVEQGSPEVPQPMCPLCLTSCPRCLCFPTQSDSVADHLEVQEFFRKIDSVALQLEAPEFHKRIDKRHETSELLLRLRRATPQLVQALDRPSVTGIVDELLAARGGYGLITDEQCQDIEAEHTTQQMVRKLLHIVATRGDEAIITLVRSLESDCARRPDLARLITD